MKKTSFVIAILASALLGGACGGKKAAPATPPAGETGTPPPPATGSGSDMGSAAGSGSGSSM
jgi:hypothetical protein